MKHLSLTAAALAIACAGTASAKEANASDSLVQNYMRSSLYTIILNSDTQNAFYEEETKKGEVADGGIMAMAKSLAKTDEKKAANDDHTGSIFALPAMLFPTIEIPNQFNDHNLATRVVNFDSIRGLITPEEKAQFAVKKKGGFGTFAKSMAGMSTATDNANNEFDEYAPAVINRFFTSNNIAPGILAKWYDYNPESEQRWGIVTITDRGIYNFTPADVEKAATDFKLKKKIDDTAFNMISNTYVMAVNLRFRSYQAIVAEASAMAQSVGSQFGGLGSLAASAASAGASAAAGDGYTVQAVSSLYRLKWNNDINDRFGEEIFAKNASLEDLIASGICELEFIGTEKSSSNIRQSLFSDKPISSLVKRATARAIDQAIIKLQNNHEEFRTVLPIIGGDGNGIIYAALGTKEGLNEKDEYEILEAREDNDGKRSYKAVGTVKAVKGKIWNNAYGAEEEVAENEKATDEEKAALNYGYTEFKGKKGDYTGYYLRLKKKK